MAHKRKLIREEICTILRNELTLVSSSNVYESRVEPIFESSKIPAIAVYTRSETAESFDSPGTIYHRTLNLAVEVLVQGNSDSDDSIDAICEEIEEALNKTENLLSENYHAIEYIGTDVAFIGEGRVPKAAARLNYNIEYRTEEI